LKTSRSTAPGQQTGARAPVRSTSARARSTPAKPLRPVDAKAPTPASRPQPGDDFAPLFAALVALCQAHEGARSAPARALLAALAAILDLCRRYLAAPPGWRLMAGASEGDALGMFAGLSLIAPAPPAPPPAAPRAPQAPVEEPSAGLRPMGPLHKMLGSQTLITIEQLGDLSDALDSADGEARRMMEPDGGGATVAGIRVDLEEARDHLRLALCSLCGLSAVLTGEETGASTAAHAAALARLELLAGTDRARADWADWNRKKLCKAFRDDAV